MQWILAMTRVLSPQGILIISACAYVYLRSLLLPREQSLEKHQKNALTGISTQRLCLRHPHLAHGIMIK